MTARRRVTGGWILGLLALLLVGCEAKGPSLRSQLAEGDMNAIRDLKAKGVAALPQVVGFLTDSNPRVVNSAALVLSSLGPQAASAAGPLVAALTKDPTSANLQDAVKRVGPAAMPALVTAVETGSPAVKRELAILIAHFGKAAAPALGAITKLLDSTDPQTRMNAIAALEAMGKAATPAIPKLEEVAGSVDDQTRTYIRRVVRRIRAAR